MYILAQGDLSSSGVSFKVISKNVEAATNAMVSYTRQVYVILFTDEYIIVSVMVHYNTNLTKSFQKCKNV